MGESDADILAGLDFDVSTPQDVTDVSTLSRYELDNLTQDTRQELIQLQQMHLEPHQRSERGKELHSLFLACQIERQKRIQHNQ